MIEWDSLLCDNCPKPSNHACIDDPQGNRETTIRAAYCEDCYAIHFAGTIWVEWPD